MKLRKVAITLLCAALVFLWIGGVIAHGFLGGPPPHVAWTAPLFLIIAGAIVLLTAERKLLPHLAIAGAIGFAAEVVGVHSGVLFGKYQYTTALYPQMFDVPLVMVCAWVVLAAFTQQIVATLGLSRLLTVPLFATVLTVFDFLIDPVAAGPLSYWTWEQPGRYYGIPASNFVGWWIVSAGIALAMKPTPAPNPWHRFVGYVITTFFTVLAAVNGMNIIMLIGVALLIISGTLFRIPFVAISNKSDSAGSDMAGPRDLLGVAGVAINATQRGSEAIRSVAHISKDKKTEGVAK